jgi:hypothetical protein
MVATNQSESAGSAIGLTTAEMQGQAARTNMSGFDFEAIWRTTDSYPELRAPGEGDGSPAPESVVNATASSISPTTAAAGESQTYTVSITIENTSLNDTASGEVVVRFREFNLSVDDDELDGPEEEIRIDYTGANLSDGIINVTETVSATAPSVTGTYPINVTDVEVQNDGNSEKYLIEDVRVTVDAVDVVEPSSGTIAVDAVDGTDNGSAPYATIGAALEAAAPNATISLAPGTYDGFTVGTEQVSIVGNDNSTVIEGTVHLAAAGVELRETRVVPSAFDAETDNGATQAVLVTEDEVTVDENIIIARANLTTEDSSESVKTRAVQVRGTGDNPASGVVVSNNTIQAEATRNTGTVGVVGVVDSGNTNGTRILNNDINVTGGDDTVAIVTRAGTVEDAAPTTDVLFNDITVMGNERSNGVGYRVRSTENAQVDVGKQLIKYNDFENVDVIQHQAATGTLDLTVNHWTDPGEVAFTSGDTDNPAQDGGTILFDPVLTKEKNVADIDELLTEIGGETVATTRDYGSYIEVETDGEPTVIGFPAPPAEPLKDLLSNETIEREEGQAVSIFVYDNAEQSFNPVTGEYTPEVGEVIVITTEGGTDLSDDFVIPIETEPSSVAGAPSDVDLTEGWNLVATGAADGTEDPAVAGADIILGGQFQVQPQQPGAPDTTVGGYDGTWLFVDNNGQLFTGFVEDQPPAVYFNQTLSTD